MPFPNVPNPWLFYRLGPTKEKGLFKRHRDTYDGVVIPAHIATYYNKFCSEFVGSLAKPYFIDPMTYVFANDPAHLRRFVKDKKTGRTKKDASGRKRKGDIRRSYSKLVVQDYQGVIQQAVQGNRRLTPADLEDPLERKRFVARVVEFQKTRLSTIPEKYKKYAAYARKAGKEISTVENPPMCLVAPYFLTTTFQSGSWYEVNLELVRETKRIAGDLPVFAVVLASSQVLGHDAKRISRDYTAAGTDGYLLWPDGFSSEQDPSALEIVFNAVSELSKGGKPTLLLYGGPFSLTLHYAGLSGFVCGICYGEQKLSTQDIDVEGAIPPRYYISGLKKKVVIETEAKRIRIHEYPDLVCECAVCQRKPDAGTQDDTESREHFMLARAAEVAELRGGLQRADFSSALVEAFEQHSGDPLLRPIAHLQNWAALL